MNISRFSIENHHFTLMVVLLLMLYGIFAVVDMPKSENPAIEPPGASIIALYPGATPQDMEEQVTSIIEEEVNSISDVAEIYSISGNSYCNITVEFDFGVDIDEKYSLLVEKVNRAKNDLPDDISSLDVVKWDINAVNILELALVSETAEYVDMETELEKLKDVIEKIEGIRGAEIVAYPEQQVRVSLNLEKMAQMHIPVDRVIGVIQSANANIPGGKIDIGGKNFNINTSGSYETLDDIRNTTIPMGNGSIIYLKDIATVQYDYEDLEHYARFNGKRAVLLAANQKNGTNLFQIIDEIKAAVADFNKDLPDNMHVAFVYNQSESVGDFVVEFLINLLEGILLVGIVAWLGIGTRPALLVIFTIPASIAIALGFLKLSDYGIQQMTIAGLVIVLGILVDNAIVVTENVNRFLRMGKDLKEASVRGATQISGSITSGTITTCLAFMPILLMSDVAGQYVRSMPLTVIFTLLASLFLALTFTPYLTSRYLSVKSASNTSLMQKTLQNFIETHYRRVLKFALKRPKTVLLLSILIFLISVGLVPFVGVSMFPKSNKPMFYINVSTPEGTNLQVTDHVVTQVEELLDEKGFVRHFVANIGGDNPRIYYNVIPKQNHANIGQVFVEVYPDYSRQVGEIVSGMREELKEIPGAKFEVKQLEQGYPNDAPIAIKVVGKDMDIIKDLSAQVESVFRNTTGVIEIDDPLGNEKTDLKIDINREKCAMLGLTLAEVDRAIRIALSGYDVSTFRNRDGDQFDIIVRLPVHESPRISDFERIYLTTPAGSQVPLKQVASIGFESSPLNIYRYQLERSNTVTGDAAPAYSVDQLTGEIIEKLDNMDWPAGYGYHVSGEKESQGKAFGGLGNNFIIAIIGIFSVLVFQFRSFRQPFIIFSSIPLAIIGSILALLITGNTFSFTAMIGLTSLAGIVINNAIILVDYANELRNEGKDLDTAVSISGETRFTPIILTVATTIGGLLPLTLFGGLMWAPMGWAIIGGLMTSTFLTLVVVPVLYKVFTPSIPVTE